MAPRHRIEGIIDAVRERVHEPLGQAFIDTVLGPRLVADAASSLGALIDASKAHLVMLHWQGLIRPEAARLVGGALRRIEREGLAPERLDPAREDLYANLEFAVREAVGEDAAGRMHLGRSRNDLGATVARMNARALLGRTAASILDLRERLLALAGGHAETIIPGYTHLQPAQPITVGFYLAGVERAVARDWERLWDAHARVDLCPLGAGALAGTSFSIDRELMARLLGFARPLANALDAVASRDYVLEILSGFAGLALMLARLAEDLYLWSSTELGYADVSGAVAIASSIMPQKKNAAAIEHVKGRAGAVVGALAAALTATKGTHFMHSRDTSVEVVAPLAEAERALGVMLALITAVLDAISFRPDVGRARAAADFSTVTDLADALVRECDLPFRAAHEICAVLVREAVDAGHGPESIHADRVNAVAGARAGRPIALGEATVRDALDPEACVGRRRHLGGPAPGTVREAIGRAASQVAADRARLEARQAALAAARAELERALAQIIGD